MAQPMKDIPLYPSEAEIAEAVLGPRRSGEWKSLAVILERHGLPKIIPQSGARYWPAVQWWLDWYKRQIDAGALAPVQGYTADAIAWEAPMRPLREMPLFPSEEEVAFELLGPGKLGEWKGMAPILERRGLPPIDPMFGRRYWPAVKQWLDFRYNIGDVPAPQVPDGEEDWSCLTRPRKGRKPAST